MAADMPEQSSRAMLKHGPSMMREQCSSNAINERTNVTYVQLTYFEHQSHVGQRAQGGSEISPVRVEFTPAADAARGHRPDTIGA